MLPRLAAFILVLLFGFTPGMAQEKALRGVALVIGQEDYAHLPDLANPGNDARAIQTLLTDLGFEARAVSNRDHEKLSRDLGRFIEDAADADVALLYYSGHGIEAGGENYLLPVNADVSSLSDARKTLIPVSQIISGLQSTVPLTIVLLDACRNSPFPANSMIVTGQDAAPVSIGATGLAIAKGMEIVGEKDGQQSGQTLIGFAAAPGFAAFDGAAGDNSPYAAALLKHLAAAKGYNFGDVMTMVSEEVYLQTAGRQQPWINTNLRHLLYFGLAPDAITGDDALIADARRKLLLTIAKTPDEIRKTVEAVALTDKVPLATLYGMLNALHVDTAGDDLERQLRTGADNLKTILADRDMREKRDPELIRLSGLANKAEQEGAITLALDFRVKASARADAINRSLDLDEANIKARRIELADTYAEHAETAILNFDYKAASQKFAAAYEQARGRDDVRALRYKLAEANTLTNYGDYEGDNDVLRHAIETYDAALTLAPRAKMPIDWARVQSDRGTALATLGERETGNSNLAKAVAAFEAALEERSREDSPIAWAMTQQNLAYTLATLGGRESGTATLEKAVKAFEAVLQVRTRERMPLDWALTQNNLGVALMKLGERESGTESLKKAVDTFQAVLQVRTRENAPLDWAMTENNLGAALIKLSERESRPVYLEAAVKALEAALKERTRERVPLQWAMTQDNLGNALTTLGAQESGTANLEKAVRAYEAALEEYQSSRAPLERARSLSNLGYAVSLLGERESGTAHLERAVAIYKEALALIIRDTAPSQWGWTQSNLGQVLWTLGKRTSNSHALRDAKAANNAAWEIYTSAGQHDYDAFFTQRNAEIDALLAGLK